MNWNRKIGRAAATIVSALALLGNTCVMAQDRASAAQAHFKNNAERYQASPQDLAQLLVTDVTPSEGGLQHVYLRQSIDGIGIYGAEMSVTFDAQGRAVSEWAQAVAAAQSRANLAAPVLSQRQAIEAAAVALELPAPLGLALLQDQGGPEKAMRLSGGNVSQEDIPLRLMYVQAPNGTLRLVWDFNLLPPGSSHWWSLKVDAETGDILDQVDWTAHCRFDGGPLRYGSHAHDHDAHCAPAPLAPHPPLPNS